VGVAAGLHTGAAGIHTGVEKALTAVEDDSTWHPLLQRLRLGHKFTAMLVLTFLIGTGIAGFRLHQVLQARAEAEVVSRGELLSGFSDAIRAHTNNDLTPLLLPNVDVSEEQEFVMETVPTFATKRVFALLQSDPAYKSFEYKAAALNPTNPADHADTAEAEIVARFRNDRSLAKLSGYRNVNGESMFYTARPLSVTSERCLACHSEPSAAPPSMVAHYGSDAGFGWELGETVAAQMVYVPASEILDSAHRAFLLIMGIFVLIFAAVIILINVLLRRLVVWPAHRMSTVAAMISQGELGSEAAARNIDTLDGVARRHDELGQSARALQKMAREVFAREQRLKEQVQQLRIEIDQAKKDREVQEIVETDFFQDLKDKAGRLRRTPGSTTGQV